MKLIFIDANVLVAVLNKEYPVFSAAARVLSLADRPGHKLCTTALCLAIAFYFAEKKCGRAKARQKLALLAEKLQVIPCDRDAVAGALANKSALDLEDGIQYYAALAAGCSHIITENTADFYFGVLQVQTCEQYLTTLVRTA
ncbi:MAG: type II toxin-antitoxin system VapC family toxin [Bacteroidetes bacterium]|nr:MAG: type II toxin-antitoxin system VapC family toxin [Bacteroidota bacterium]